MKRASLSTTAALTDSLAPRIARTNACPQCHSKQSYIASSRLAQTPRRRGQSSWAAAVNVAQQVFNGRTDPPLPGGVQIDPFRVVAKEMKFLTKNMQQLVGAGHPVLHTVSQYYTQSDGKHIRPMLVLLMSQATAHAPKAPQRPQSATSILQQSTIDTPISPSDILEDTNPLAPSPLDERNLSSPELASSDILPSQRRLAEITELIHTASLLHDDVIDHSATRRGLPSANMAFGNKMAVLAGDFLLGRASIALARLRNPEVTELVATVIANLIEGEFMQLRNTALDEALPTFNEDATLDYYLRKTYLKSASLISKSCRAAALLGGSAPATADAAYAYGKNLGLAFQLVDDMLDFSAPAASSDALGKPAGADLALGLATAPLLFAWRAHPELGELVGRKFAEPGDVERARELVARSDGVERTRALAQEYADLAADALLAGLPESEAREGLREMCAKVMQRKR